MKSSQFIAIVVCLSLALIAAGCTDSEYTLYIINNQGSINHEVTVELFDSKNTSIFSESYMLAPDEQIKSESNVGLADRTRIEVTLDNNTTETEVVLGDLSDIAILSIDIDAHHDDSLDLSIAVP